VIPSEDVLVTRGGYERKCEAILIPGIAEEQQRVEGHEGVAGDRIRPHPKVVFDDPLGGPDQAKVELTVDTVGLGEESSEVARQAMAEPALGGGEHPFGRARPVKV
jgi:hypothetical protein